VGMAVRARGEFGGYRWTRPFVSRQCAGAKYCHCFDFLLWYRFIERTSGVAVMRSISKGIAFVCILLTTWSAIAFITHRHSSGTESATCSVCVAANSATPNAPSALPHGSVVAISTFRSEPLSTQQRLVIFALSVRPPPQV
jgi:hypothetical protein